MSPSLPSRLDGGGRRTTTSSSVPASARPPPPFTVAPDHPPTFTRLVAPGPAPDFRSAARLVTVTWADPPPDHVVVRIAYAGVNGGCETFRVRGEAGTAFARNAGATPAVGLVGLRDARERLKLR